MSEEGTGQMDESVVRFDDPLEQGRHPPAAEQPSERPLDPAPRLEPLQPPPVILVGLYPLVKTRAKDLVRERKIGTEVFVTVAIVACVHEMFTLGIAVECGGEAVGPDVGDEPRIIKLPGCEVAPPRTY